MVVRACTSFNRDNNQIMYRSVECCVLNSSEFLEMYIMSKLEVDIMKLHNNGLILLKYVIATLVRIYYMVSFVLSACYKE